MQQKTKQSVQFEISEQTDVSATQTMSLVFEGKLPEFALSFFQSIQDTLSSYVGNTENVDFPLFLN